jgi:predicted transcriptional regulator
MTKTTVSAHVSPEVITRLDSIAKTERRNRSQVVSMALDFFLALPTPAREAWLKIITTGSPQQIESFLATIVRVTLTAQYQMIQEGDSDEEAVDHLELLESDVLDQRP